MTVRFASAAAAFETFDEVVRQLAAEPGVRRVCEVGAGANPMLSLEFLDAHGLECVLVDVSSEELTKAPDGYEKVQANIVTGAYRPPQPFDLVFSRVLAEHVRDPMAFHGNVRGLLGASACAAHFFPTLYWPPFVVNRLLPEVAARVLLRAFQDGREPGGRRGKFPAYYKWCRGPLRRQVARFERVGFEVQEYAGFFGQPDYVSKIAPLAAIDDRLTSMLLARPVALLTSYAYVVLRKRAR